MNNLSKADLVRMNNNTLIANTKKTDDIHYNKADKKIYSNKNNTPKKAINLVNERNVDVYIIDGDDEPNVSTKNKKNR